MNLEYLITLRDVKDMTVHLISIKTLDEVATFLAHVDKDAYAIDSVTSISPLNTEYGHFLKKEPTLEHGGEK